MAKADIDKRVREAARMLGIEALLKRRPKELSGGQRQRVAVGRAIVREPAVFLMDEPLSNLDAKMRVETRAELIKLHRRLGITTIYVTHDQVEAMTMGDRIAVMKDGLVQQLDTPLGLFYNPSSMFVAGFIGSPPMNFADATTVVRDGGVYVEARDFSLRLPPTKAKQAEAVAGKPVVLGLRPEGIHDRAITTVDATDGNTLTATVDVLEPMGADSVLYLSVGETHLVASMDSVTKAREGKPLDLVIDLERLYLFDAASEQAVFTAATGHEDLLASTPHG